MAAKEPRKPPCGYEREPLAYATTSAAAIVSIGIEPQLLRCRELWG